MGVHTAIVVFHTQTYRYERIRASFTFSGQLVNEMSSDNSVIVRNNGFQESLPRMNSFARNHVRIKRTNLDLIRLDEKPSDIFNRNNDDCTCE